MRNDSRILGEGSPASPVGGHVVPQVDKVEGAEPHAPMTRKQSAKKTKPRVRRRTPHKK